jgi:lipid-A-disaccharide synthase
MGLVEVLKVLPELLRLRRVGALFHRQSAGCLHRHRRAGLQPRARARLRASWHATVHMVSPTVWAWRSGRVKGIRRAVDLMLSIFPFEEAFLREHGVPARYVGHPLADEIPLQVDAAGGARGARPAGRRELVALLPGSRMSEVSRLAGRCLETALWCRERPGCVRRAAGVRALYRSSMRGAARSLPISICLLLHARSREAIAAADCVLTASGTATLETLLLKRPMLVAYRINALTYRLVMALKLIKVPYAAMANLLVGRELAQEFLQARCRADLMAPALLALLDDAPRRAAIAPSTPHPPPAATRCRAPGGRCRARPDGRARPDPMSIICPSNAWYRRSADKHGRIRRGADRRRRRGRSWPAGRTGLRRRRHPASARIPDGLDDSKRLSAASASAWQPQIEAHGPVLVGRLGQRRGDRSDQHPASIAAGHAPRGRGLEQAPTLAHRRQPLSARPALSGASHRRRRCAGARDQRRLDPGQGGAGSSDAAAARLPSPLRFRAPQGLSDQGAPGGACVCTASVPSTAVLVSAGAGFRRASGARRMSRSALLWPSVLGHRLCEVAQVHARQGIVDSVVDSPFQGVDGGTGAR